MLVLGAVAWNLASLRALTLSVAYLDDSSLHEQMVRFATAELRAGHLPLTGWFPYLGLGSPQFLHYQSLPAIIAGAIGLVIGPNVAFSWTLYLLLSLWPVSVYLGARLLGASRGGAGAAAAMSPFLWSATGIGYEQHAYLWTGFGVWTQLWASFTLPLAWGFSWRWIRDGRHALAAVVLTALTLALHFETGYLALIPLLVWPLVAGAPLMRRIVRAVLVIVGALSASAWVIVPLLAQRAWAAQNELLAHTPLANGYGIGRVLGWLLSGQLLDHGRLPVLTLFAAIGLVLMVGRCRRDADARALLVALALCLLLSFGRASFGSLVALIPGSSDIFFRRFEMGVQLAALLLAGLGAAWTGRVLWECLPTPVRRPGLRAIAALLAAVIVLTPAWIELGRYDANNATAIAAQRRADATQGTQLGRLLARIRRNGGGRVYAGEPTNWGASFTVGAVPVFKYLESEDIDEVGYTLRTASMMTDPEYFFDDTDPSDYVLFGIRYLIVPAGYQPPVRATFTARAGAYSLWTLPYGGYLHAAMLTGDLVADRTDVGSRSIALLHSSLAQHGQELRVLWSAAGPKPLARATVTGPPGTILTVRAQLGAGRLAATVRMRRPGAIVLSASYDPGWTATIDGRRAPTVAVAPALVATRVPAGTHRIVFRYDGYREYPWLFALCGATLVALLAYERVRHQAVAPRARSA